MIETTKTYHLKVDQEAAEKWAVLNGFVNGNGNDWHKGGCNISICQHGFSVMGKWVDYHELKSDGFQGRSDIDDFIAMFAGRFEPILRIELHE